MLSNIFAGFVFIVLLLRKPRPTSAAGLASAFGGTALFLAFIVYMAYVFAGATGDPRQMTAAASSTFLYLALPTFGVMATVSVASWLFTGRNAATPGGKSGGMIGLVVLCFVVGFIGAFVAAGHSLGEFDASKWLAR